MPDLQPGGLLRLRADQLEHELNLARQVQQSLLPSVLPQLPGVTLAAVNRPARIVSGDLYDVITIDPDRLAVLVADVSGKGFPAALFASEMHAYVRASLRAACVFNDTSLGPLPVQVVALLNDEATRLSRSGRYATIFFAELDALERTLRYTNAGHNPPLLFGSPGEPVIELTEGGPPVGLLEEASYDAGAVTVKDGASVLIYTDGAVEARSPADEEFGLTRLIESYELHRGSPIKMRLAGVLQQILRCCGGREPDDDITLVGLSTE